MSKAYSAKLIDATAQLSRWMRTQSLPLWWQVGRLNNGAFLEGLTMSGHPLPTRESRIRVQGRQLFCFASAMNAGWETDGLRQGLSISLDHLLHCGLRDDGVAGHKINIDQSTLVDRRGDLYDTAFFLLALAECTESFGIERTQQGITKVLSGIDNVLAYADDGVGYRERLPAPGIREQNPHMHLFEALLRLYDATRDPAVAIRINQLLASIDSLFFDHEQDCISEHWNAGRRDNHFEPGHSMEWVWLLGYYARLFDTPMQPFANRLYNRCIDQAMPEGQMPQIVTHGGRVTDASRKIWSQTEALKAHLCMLELGDPEFASDYQNRATECANTMFADFLTHCEVGGGWLNHFTADAILISEMMPASTGYHLYYAIHELQRVRESVR
ncbi:MAG: AGE family epimerase/isomerase [Woeseiaceae bacterium]